MKPFKPPATPPPASPLAAVLATALPSVASTLPTTGAAVPLALPAQNGKGPLRPAYIPLKNAVSMKKNASFRENLAWACNNSANDPEEIDVNTIPSRFAVRLLDYVQLSPANFSEALGTLKAVAADKKSSEAAAAAEFDEHRQTRQLDRILERYNGVTETETQTGDNANLPGT